MLHNKNDSWTRDTIEQKNLQGRSRQPQKEKESNVTAPYKTVLSKQRQRMCKKPASMSENFEMLGRRASVLNRMAREQSC